MKYYPINLNLDSSFCLVVGAGSVAYRKIKTLLECNANIKVVSPKIDPRIKSMYKKKLIDLKVRNYNSLDLLNCSIVIGATNNERLNSKISKDAHNYNIFCNIVDKPEICTFILPAIIRRGDLILSISTSGKSPAFARKLKKELELSFGNEYSDLLKLMGSIRTKLLNSNNNQIQRKILFQKLLKNNLLELCKKQDISKIDKILNSILGPTYQYTNLIK